MLGLQEPEAGSQGLQIPTCRHHRLVHEDPLAPLLVRGRLQCGEEVLRL